MAIPTFQAVGTAVAAGNAATAVAWPAHAVGDIAFLAIEADTAISLSTPSGFVAVSGSPVTTGTGSAHTTLGVYWCRATSTSMPNVVVGAPGDHFSARIMTVRGAVATGDPIHVVATNFNATATTAIAMPGVTTTDINTLICLFTARGDDSAGVHYGTWANAGGGTVTERMDNGTATGNGGGFGAATMPKATAGATNTFSAVSSASVEQANLTLAVLEAKAGDRQGATSVSFTPSALLSADVPIFGAATLSFVGAAAADGAMAGSAGVSFVGSATGDLTAVCVGNAELRFYGYLNALPLPSLQSVSTAVGAATGTRTYAWPAGAYNVGDIAFLVVEHQGAHSLSTPAGFVHVSGSPVIGVDTALSVYWCRATSTSMATPVGASSSDHQWGQMVIYTNTKPTGIPFDLSATATKDVASTDVTIPSLDGRYPGSMILGFASRADDSDTTTFDSFANENASVSERTDTGTIFGNGGGFCAVDMPIKGIGPTGVISATTSVASTNAVLALALLPSWAQNFAAPTTISFQVTGTLLAAGSNEITDIEWSQSSVYNNYENLRATRASMRDANVNASTGAATGAGVDVTTGQKSWIKADLGTAKNVERLRFGGGEVTNWGLVAPYLNTHEVEYSNDDSTWTPLLTVSGVTDTVPLDQEFSFSPVTARYFRLITSGLEAYLATATFRLFETVATGDIAGTVALSFVGSGTLFATMPLSGTTALTFAPSATLAGATLAVGAAALTFAQTGVLTGAGVLTGTAAGAFSVQAQLQAGGAVTGTTALTFSSTATAAGALPAEGTAAFVFAPSAALGGVLPAEGTTALTFAAAAFGEAVSPITGETTLTFEAEATTAAGSDLAGDIALTFAAAAAALAGAGALSGTATGAFSVQAQLQAGGAVTGATTLSLTAAATLTGAGAVMGATALTFAPAASITGTASLAGTAALTLTIEGAITGAGALAGTTALAFEVVAQPDLAPGQAVGQTSVTFTTTAMLSAQAAVEGAATLAFASAGTAAGTAAGQGAAQITFAPSATGTLTAFQAGQAQLAFAAAAVLLGIGRLQGATAFQFVPAGTLQLDAQLAGSTALAFEAFLFVPDPNRPPPAVIVRATVRPTIVRSTSRPVVELADGRATILRLGQNAVIVLGENRLKIVRTSTPTVIRV